MKIIKWYKVFWNSIVLKENEKFFTLHNLSLLNWEPWSYLETYFLRKDFDESRFLEVWEEIIIEMLWNLEEKYLNFFNEQNKTEQDILDNIYDRSSDFIIKEFISKIKERMNIDYSFEEWLDILSELPEHSNNLTHVEIRENFDKLDVEELLKNPEVDSYVKDCLRDIVDNKTINNDLDESNKSFFKFREIEKKKDLWDRIKEWAKKVWKVTLIWSVLAWLALSFTAPHVNAAEIHQEIESNSVISQDVNQITNVQQATKENLVFKWINKEDWYEVNLNNIEWLAIFKSDWTIINYWSFNFKSYSSSKEIFWKKFSKLKSTWASWWSRTVTRYEDWINLDVMDLKWIELSFNWEKIKLDHWSYKWLQDWEIKMIIKSWWKTYKVDNDHPSKYTPAILALSITWFLWWSFLYLSKTSRRE